MPSTSPTAVRCGLLGVFALVASALVVPNALAQFGPRPPTFPPIPRPPTFPRPGFGGGLPGIPENIYYCKKCNTELGRGAFPPASATCACGLTYRNGTAWDNGRDAPFGGVPGMPRMPNPGMPAPPFNPNPNPNPQPPRPQPQPVSLPELPAVYAESVGTADNAPQPAVTPVSPEAATPAPVVIPPKSSSRWLVIIGGVVLGLLVVLGMIVGVLYAKAHAKQASKPVRRRSRDIDDE